MPTRLRAWYAGEGMGPSVPWHASRAGCGVTCVRCGVRVCPLGVVATYGQARSDETMAPGVHWRRVARAVD